MAAVVIIPARDHVDVMIFMAFFLHTHVIFFLPSESTWQQVRAFNVFVCGDHSHNQFQYWSRGP